MSIVWLMIILLIATFAASIIAGGIMFSRATRENREIIIRTCPHRVNVRIFRHNFVGGKAKIRRRAVALQGFLTKSPAKFDEKTCMNPYVDRF